MSVDETKEMEAFEIHFAREWGVSRMSHEFDRARAGEFASTITQDFWQGWLARSRAQSAPQWIPVGEQLPASGQTVLIADSGESSVAFCTYWPESNYPWDAGDDYYTDVTHWLPFPAKPPTTEPKP